MAPHGVIKVVVPDQIVQSVSGDPQTGKAEAGTDESQSQGERQTAPGLKVFGLSGQQEQPEGEQGDEDAAQIADNHAEHHVAEIRQHTAGAGQDGNWA